MAFLRDAVAPGSYLTISHIGTECFLNKLAIAQAKAVYERASEPIWARRRDQILGFFDGFELLEPGLVPKHQWRSVTGQAATGAPNIQWARWAVSPSPVHRTGPVLRFTPAAWREFAGQVKAGVRSQTNRVT